LNFRLKEVSLFWFCLMKAHQRIDERSLAMARAIVARIDNDPSRAGLVKARATCQRWYRDNPAPAIGEWLGILEKPWEEIRAVLLDESEEGRRLRQSDPFCGIITPPERWEIYRAYYMTRSELEHIYRRIGGPVLWWCKTKTLMGSPVALVAAMLRHRLVTADEIQVIFPEMEEEPLKAIRPRLQRCQSAAFP
jgi:hypothetical protein